VIVTRSNGDKTFGTIDKVTSTVSYIRACKYAHVYVYACVHVCVDVDVQTYDICMKIFFAHIFFNAYTAIYMKILTVIHVPFYIHIHMHPRAHTYTCIYVHMDIQFLYP